ncbi:MAG: [FeFe] hydrogenase H-cluster radical SAM maturase HydE [Ruminococcaceae bacterium]|nr:[FeFe] hydrogenase H-cluster radical SAM maturase HydE [Oscillospiraceae bacterium]
MNKDIYEIIDKLKNTHSLTKEEYLVLIKGRNPDTTELLMKYANEERKKYYGKEVFLRGLIEVSNICKNDCYYCGIRKSNPNCQRYRLTPEDILMCCKEGYELGFRTFVLQGGEDGYFTDDILCELIKNIKKDYPDCAVTLSLGERSKESYIKLKEAGADRYLLRHETADKNHYEILHPPSLSYDERMRCLKDLREVGFQVGCGFMVGSPGQTDEHIAGDLKFIEEFKPDMCGIGPFIPHKDTKFKDAKAGSVALTCYLLSIIRLIHPTVLLPATTALGTMDETGREKGILSGANVVMPNLSPKEVRKKYMLYDNKLSDGAESAQAKEELKRRIESIGYTISTSRGDVYKKD